MSSVVRQESLVDRIGLWMGGWALSAAVWGPVQVVAHPDKVLGDGGLGAIGLLVMLAGWVFFVVIGVAAFREEVHERSDGVVEFATARVLGLGAAAWIAERQALVDGGHQVTTAVALVASVLMPFVFIAAL